MPYMLRFRKRDASGKTLVFHPDTFGKELVAVLTTSYTPFHSFTITITNPRTNHLKLWLFGQDIELKMNGTVIEGTFKENEIVQYDTHDLVIEYRDKNHKIVHHSQSNKGK